MSEDFRNTLYTVDKRGNRKWVYPDIVHGFFVKRRAIIAYGLMVFYLTMPWLRVGGEQAIFLDFAHRKFTFFGNTFWATDTVFFLFVLVGLGLALFLFTALFGRVWCGWACPETVFLEFLFRPIERLVEGTASQRRRLDAAPWTVEKIRKKVVKHGISAMCAWFIASTAIAYVVGADTLFEMVQGSPFDNPVPFALTIIMMGLMAFQFGWFREQFCTVVCPYARFQSVLMDADSIVVGYDTTRGEPRGKLKRGATEDGKGDCIDCKLCVRVCPTGIDIRNGLQLECVACTACVDACDSIMEKIDKPHGLIRYDTENHLAGKSGRFFRPRIVVYAVIAVVYIGLFSFLLATRQTSEAHIVRGSADVPYSVDDKGSVSNHLHLRISNKSTVTRSYTVRVLSHADEIQLIAPMPFPVPAGTMNTLPVFAQFKNAVLSGGKRRIELEIQDDAGYRQVLTVTLIGPE